MLHSVGVRTRLPVLLLCASLVPAALTADSPAESRKLFLRAHLAMADGRYREALDLLRKVIDLEPEDPVLRYEYAQLLRDLNVGDEAIRGVLGDDVTEFDDDRLLCR